MSILTEVLKEELDRLNREEAVKRAWLQDPAEPEKWRKMLQDRLKVIAEDRVRLLRALEPVPSALQELYEVARNIAPSEAMRAVQAAETDEARAFYGYIAQMNLQRAQKVAIEKNLF